MPDTSGIKDVLHDKSKFPPAASSYQLTVIQLETVTEKASFEFSHTVRFRLLIGSSGIELILISKNSDKAIHNGFA